MLTDIYDQARALDAWIDSSSPQKFPDGEQLFPPQIDQRAAHAALAHAKISVICVAPGMRQVRIGLENKLPSRDRDRLPTRFLRGNAIAYYRIKGATSASPTTTTSVSPFLRNDRYPCGSSISVANAVRTGTMGCLVRIDGRLHGLSNNHVAAGLSYLTPGMPISGPGLLDIGPRTLDPSVIGYHAACSSWRPGIPDNVSITENLDLAIFRIKTEDAVTSFQGAHYDTPGTSASVQTIMATHDCRVIKVGRTTGLTSGELLGHNVRRVVVPMIDGAQRVDVHFPYVLTIYNDASPFAAPGDSGSLVVQDIGGTTKAVGIVFATSLCGCATYVIPIETALSFFKAELVSGHNIV